MTTQKAIDILTPDKTKYTPQEYEDALEMARAALHIYDMLSSGEYKLVERED